MLQIIRLSLIFPLLLILTACGGGGGGGGGNNDVVATEQTGRFVDSAVEGMRYVTSSGISGVTDLNGSFRYEPGDTVTFYIGDIEIGQAKGSGLLTPVSLVPGAVDETDTTVINIARFLQSLDEDNNPDNGITISADIASAATGQTLNFTSTNFDTDGAALVESLRTTAYADAGTLIDTATAEAHLQGSLICERIGDYAGTWVQTDGNDTDVGTWSFTIDGAGEITGTGISTVYPEGGSFGLSGTVSSSGDSVVGNVTVGATFSGTISLDGPVSGTWSNSSFGSSGTYSGSFVRNSSVSGCNSTAGSTGGVTDSPTALLMQKTWFTTYFDDGTRFDGSVDDPSQENNGLEIFAIGDDGSWVYQSTGGTVTYPSTFVEIDEETKTVTLTDLDDLGRTILMYNDSSMTISGYWEPVVNDIWMGAYETWSMAVPTTNNDFAFAGTWDTVCWDNDGYEVDYDIHRLILNSDNTFSFIKMLYSDVNCSTFISQIVTTGTFSVGGGVQLLDGTTATKMEFHFADIDGVAVDEMYYTAAQLDSENSDILRRVGLSSGATESNNPQFLYVVQYRQ